MVWEAVAAAAADAAGQYAQAKMQQNSQNSAQGRASAIQFLMNDYFQNKQIAWEKERATHAHQWEMEDLKNANLNPALTATGGSGATTGSIGAPTNAMPNFEGLQMGTFTDMIAKLVEMRNNTKATNANSNLADSKAIEALAHADNMPKELRIKAFEAITNRLQQHTNETNAITNRNKADAGQWAQIFGADFGKDITKSMRKTVRRPEGDWFHFEIKKRK